MEVIMNEEEFDKEKSMTAEQVMEKFGCSRSLLSTPKMKIALGAYSVGKRGVRFKKSYVMRVMSGEDQIDMIDVEKKIINNKANAKNFESQIGLW